jgi:hypothetical protein
MQTNTKTLIIFVTVLILFIYIRFYTNVTTNIKIVQLALAELTPAILNQKNPIVIDDKIVNPISLLHTVFKYLFVSKHIKNIEDGDANVFRQNKARFLILYSNKDDNSIDIANPRFVKDNTKEPPFVEIKLHANMCMILPFKWYVRLRNPTQTTSIALEDIISLTFGKVF